MIYELHLDKQEVSNRNQSTNPRNKSPLTDDMINANIGKIYIEMPKDSKSIETAKKMIGLMKVEIESSSQNEE
jgi:hypothetical protein